MADARVLKDCQKKFDDLKAKCAAMHAEIKKNDKAAGQGIRMFNNLMRDLTARVQQLKNEGHEITKLKDCMGDKEIRQLHMIADHQIKEIGGAGKLSSGSQKQLDAALADYKALKAAIATAIKEEKGKATKNADGSKIDKGEKLLPELDKLQREVEKFDRDKDGLRGLANTDGDHDSVDLDDFRKGMPKAIARIKAAPSKEGKSFKDAGWDADKIKGREAQLKKYEAFVDQRCKVLKMLTFTDPKGEAARDKVKGDLDKVMAQADKLAQAHKKLTDDKAMVKKLMEEPAGAALYKLVKGIQDTHKAMKEQITKAKADNDRDVKEQKERDAERKQQKQQAAAAAARPR